MTRFICNFAAIEFSKRFYFDAAAFYVMIADADAAICFDSIKLMQEIKLND